MHRPQTILEIDGTDFCIGGRRTYAGVTHEGRRIEGLLFNSRMIQAIFDDENDQTRPTWAYPDTGVWDADRNTDAFCQALPRYRDHGVLGVTVGLQGGGAVYTSPIYEQTITSAFAPDGALKEPYMRRLAKVLRAADDLGMIVIVNYFYWRQERFDSDDAIRRATENATGWLLNSGHRNIMVDVKNEIKDRPGLLQAQGIHELLQIVRGTTLAGRRLPVGVSTHPQHALPPGDWPNWVDLFMPHGNDALPDAWRKELRALKASSPLRSQPRPILCNEDSTDIRNLEVSVDEGCSWGYYDQGYGCGQYQAKVDWSVRGRETRYEDLSGFQTVPVNWSINTPHKRAFFERVRQIVGG